MAINAALLTSDPLMDRTGWTARPSGKVTLVRGWEPPGPDASTDGTDTYMDDVGKGDDEDTPISINMPSTNDVGPGSGWLSGLAGPADAVNGLGQKMSDLGSWASDLQNRVSSDPNAQAAANQIRQAGDYLSTPIEPVQGIKNVPSDVGNTLKFVQNVANVTPDVVSEATQGTPYTDTGLSKVPVVGGLPGMVANPVNLAFGPAGAAAKAIGLPELAGTAALGAAQGGLEASADPNSTTADVAIQTAIGGAGIAAMHVGGQLAGKALNAILARAQPIIGDSMGNIAGRIADSLNKGDYEGATDLVNQVKDVTDAHTDLENPHNPSPGYGLDRYGQVVRSDTGESLSTGPGAAHYSDIPDNQYPDVTSDELQKALDTGTQDQTTWGAIGLAADRFQHRQRADSEGNAGRIKTPFSPALQGEVTVWQDNTGKDWLVNGHNRYAAAKSADMLNTPVNVLRLYEKDGVTPQSAKTVGALQNISSDDAEPGDIADFVRNLGPDQAMANMKQIGVDTSSAAVRDGLGLAGLSPDMYTNYMNGTFDNVFGEDGYKIAVTIGRTLADNPVGQADAFQIAQQKGLGRKATDALAQMIRAGGSATGGQQGMFGDLASNADFLAAKASVIAAMQEELRLRTSGKLSSAETQQFLAEHGQSIDATANAAMAKDDRTRSALFQSYWPLLGDTSQSINAAADKVAQGASVKSVIPDVRTAFEQERTANGVGAPREPQAASSVPPPAEGATPQQPADIPGPNTAEAGTNVGEPGTAPVEATSEPSGALPPESAPLEQTPFPGTEPGSTPAAGPEATATTSGTSAEIIRPRSEIMTDINQTQKAIAGARAADQAIHKRPDASAAKRMAQQHVRDIQAKLQSLKAELTAHPGDEPAPEVTPPTAAADSMADVSPSMPEENSAPPSQGSLPLPTQDPDPIPAAAQAMFGDDSIGGRSPEEFVRAIIDGGIKWGAGSYDRDPEALVNALTAWTAEKGRIAPDDVKSWNQLKSGIRQAYQPQAMENTLAKLDRGGEMNATDMIALHFAKFRSDLALGDAVHRGDGQDALAAGIDKTMADKAINSAPEPSTSSGDQLPDHLQKAKPTYNYGAVHVQPEFENDLEKAIYIATNKGESKSHQEFVDFLHSNGLTDDEIARRGAEIRANIKQKLVARGLRGGPLKVDATDARNASTGVENADENGVVAPNGAEVPAGDKTIGEQVAEETGAAMATEDLSALQSGAKAGLDDDVLDSVTNAAVANALEPSFTPEEIDHLAAVMVKAKVFSTEEMARAILERPGLDRAEFVQFGIPLEKGGAAVPPGGTPPATPAGATPTGPPPPATPAKPFFGLHSGPNIVSGLLSSYGVYQADDKDDEKSRIVKALLAFPAGMAVSHVPFGGPMTRKTIRSRAEETFIGGILSPTTLVVKGINDVGALGGSGIVRGTQALFQGRIKTAVPEAIAQYAGQMASLRDGLAAFMNELDPNTINRGVEPLGNGTPGLAYEHAGLSQYSATLSQRFLSAITEFSREVIKGGVERANTVAGSLAPNIEAQRGLLTGPGHAWTGKLVQGMLNLIHDKVPVLGPVLAPFRTIPGNLVEKTIDWMPGIGLANLIGADATATERTLVAQTLSIAATTALALTIGSNINGSGPSDPKALTAWRNAGNKPWTVKIGNQWMGMDKIPAPVRGPMMAWAGYMDAQRYGANANTLTQAGAEFGNALDSLDFFPQLFQTVADVMNGQGSSALKYFAASTASEVVPWEVRKPAQGEQTTAPDTSSRYVSDPLEAAKRGFESAVPGLERNVPPAINNLGQPRPNTNQGIGAVVNPFKVYDPQTDPTIDAYAQHGLNIGPPPADVGGAKTPFTLPEQHQLATTAGPVLADQTARLMATPAFQALPPDQQKTALSELETRVRTQAEWNLIRQTPDFGKRIAAQPGYVPHPPKYQGITDPAQEMLADMAIARYTAWMRTRGQGIPPTPEQINIARAFGSRLNPEYAKWAALRQVAQRKAA